MLTLRQLRDCLGLSQAQVAEVMSCHPTYVSAIERGVDALSVAKAAAVVDAFGVTARIAVDPPRIVFEGPAVMDRPYNRHVACAEGEKPHSMKRQESPPTKVGGAVKSAPVPKTSAP